MWDKTWQWPTVKFVGTPPFFTCFHQVQQWMMCTFSVSEMQMKVWQNLWTKACQWISKWWIPGYLCDPYPTFSCLSPLKHGPRAWRIATKGGYQIPSYLMRVVSNECMEGRHFRSEWFLTWSMCNSQTFILVLYHAVSNNVPLFSEVLFLDYWGFVMVILGYIYYLAHSFFLLSLKIKSKCKYTSRYWKEFIRLSGKKGRQKKN